MKRVLALIAIAGAIGCSGSKPKVTPPSSISVVADATDAQAGTPLHFAVTALDGAGNTMTTAAGGLQITADDSGAELPSGISLDQGAASFNVSFHGAGTHVVTVKLADVSGVSQNITVAPGPVHSLELVSGDNQSGVVGAAAGQPLVVRAKDAYGNVPVGASVPFTGPAGATFDYVHPHVDAQGLATTHVTFGTTPGAQAFTATGAGSTVTFHASATIGPPDHVVVVSGDNQAAQPGQTLAQPLVAMVVDAYGNAEGAGSTVSWSASTGAAVSAPSTTSDAEGHVSVNGTLPSANTNAYFVATFASRSVRFHAGPPGLSYAAPAVGTGKIRFEMDPSSTQNALVLKAVTTVPLSGYATGADLPFKGARVTLDPFTPGSVLALGSSPAVKGVIADSGPYAGTLFVAMSQKRSDKASDTAIPAGATLYTVTLKPKSGAAPGVIYDPEDADPHFHAGLVSYTGTEVVGPADVAVGRIELH